ncbi:MAG: VOC family protein [Planctomycetota bacterium]
MARQKVTPFLWFQKDAEEAAAFYVSLFPNSRIVKIHHYPPGAPAPEGSIMSVEFELGGVPFIALNGGPHFQLNEAFSMSVECDDQEEVDRLWDTLAAGGSPSHCGWLKDKYGLSWQIVPRVLLKLLSDPDPARAKRATEAMLGMSKLDITRLEKAAAGNT